ncbi:hypothetical protein ISS37_09560 [candidate division KSB1 bacterium]|nr:hypothetical protein [candidate division KSB1 bacterium]
MCNSDIPGYDYRTDPLYQSIPFREKEIPCDVLYLDIHNMDGYRVFTWDPVRFPKPKRMLSDLEKMGFNVVVIIDPGIKVDPDYWVYQEGIGGDYFCSYPDGKPFSGEVWPGECHFPDFSSPAVREWWGGLYKGLIAQGVDGFWNDMNEPSVWEGTFLEVVLHDDGGRESSHARVHNVYGKLMARGTYEGMRKLSPDHRPFVLTRAGFARTIDARIKTTCLVCPPDDHPEDVWCAWEFMI